MIKDVTIFFATDLHGSEVCFRKFLNAGKVYNADILILGGDLAGKSIIPIFEMEGEYSYFDGDRYLNLNKNETDKIKKEISDRGNYFLITSKEEWAELMANPGKMEKVFNRLMIERIEEWVKLINERERERPIILTTGNDDPQKLLEILKSFERENLYIAEEKVIDVYGYKIAGLSYANMTPWKLPGDLPEEELHKKVMALMESIDDFKHTILDFHAPPYGTSLDLAPKLDKDLKPVTVSGHIIEEHVGSISIREAIERYQPLLGLHGHIHESKGADKIGRTLILNPGSIYYSGSLQGVLVKVKDDKVKSYFFTVG
ncbi:MAG: hypothetical protein GPW19_00395 [Euryarchaeota archaeon]|nr:hypothetical protein [Euryarchaeota archaeon]